jgi:hypothetical protein
MTDQDTDTEPTESDTTFQDPGDTPFYLLQRGWHDLRIKDTDSDLYHKKLEVGDQAMGAIVELTPGGRRKFYVRSPPDAFRTAAHDGACLTSTGLADGEDIHHVHFSTRPGSIADGVKLLKEMLNDA